MAVGDKSPKDVADVCVSNIRIAPLDRLQVPAELNGSAGKYRMHGLEQIEANTDLEAVRHWLGQYESKPTTRRSYQEAVERLVNWAIVERRKALSSLDDDDLLAFEEFLSDPQPRLRWIRARVTARSDSGWTPLVGPLSPRSRLHTIVVLRVMFDWLRSKRYCDVGRSLGRHSIGSSHQPGALALEVGRNSIPTVIRLDDWQMLSRSFNIVADNPRLLAARLAVELMYYGGLTVKEVEGACVHHIINIDSTLRLHIPSRPPKLATIYLAPPVALTIRHFLEISDVGTVRSISSTDVTGQPLPIFLIPTRTIGKLIKYAFRWAAEVALRERNSAAAARLMELSSNSLRHAFEIHVSTYDQGNHAWLLIGAAYLVPESIRRYLRRPELDDEMVQNAFRLLAPIWDVRDACL